MAKIVVPFEKRLKAKNSCPMCGADEEISFTGWTQSDEHFPRKFKKRLKKQGTWPLWVADCVEVDCSKMPNPGTKAWDEWWEQHDTPHPYIDIMPHHNAIEKSVERKYRFFNPKEVQHHG